MAGGGCRLALRSIGLRSVETCDLSDFFRTWKLGKLANSQVFWEQVFEFCALSSQAGLDVNFRHLKFGIPGDW